MKTIPELVEQATSVSTPLIAVATADPQATQEAIAKRLKTFGLISWDIARGMIALNDKGKQAVAALGKDPAELTTPGEALIVASKLPAETILFMHMAHQYLDNEQVKQATWNLRDIFKANGRCLVMLGPSFTLPAELAQDVLLLDEPLPTEAELAEIVKAQYENARQTNDPPLTKEDFPEPEGKDLERIVDACRGLAAYPSEQAIAMALRKTGMDYDDLGQRKRGMLSNIPGLTVESGNLRLSDIGGQRELISYTSDFMIGPKRAGTILRLDEFEKAMAGTGVGSFSGDSGVSSYSLQKILEAMEDWEWIGMILVSPPGCGKSLFSKAVAGTFGALALAGDIGGTRSKFVGASEQAIRTMLKTVYAVGQDRVLVIATCNDLEVLRPELRRRFGTPWYVDLPTLEERNAIWPLQLNRYGIPLDQSRPDTTGWTGAEIRNCCRTAWMLGKNLIDAANYILPVSKSDPESIKRLRQRAVGCWLSASYPGAYQIEGEKTTEGQRRIKL